MGEAQRSTVRLTHYGRKSGKPYRVTIWFVVIDGRVWLGSMKPQRSWVRNLAASGRGELDFGSGPRAFRCTPVKKPSDIERFAAAIRAKHPLTSRLLALFLTVDRCAFRTDLALDAS